MSELSISEARGRLASIIDDARHEPVYLTRRNKRVAAVVDAAVLDRLLEAAEDLDDLVAYDEAVAESARIGGENVKWDDLKRELGLG
ncbi:type II toxin-antitoxin system Phd/YefM family antitoxin [Curtobacterium flaccumfaciens]|uniref:type II toxin-antitoxin system Phd/YefM family antitoxin n=1 Tax=Curtobacterium flaccumfaciens TaxID=2035 RepID=UPI002203C3E5|nr:type II toxin-antitoxin system Phd/YefM family antitoxin [Curtobacterium flaccumfaciens]UWD82490.1 type II toxin-antitoxin system Phd/YefM family antitoxin [Curtobacterium flaccumfaciens]